MEGLKEENAHLLGEVVWDDAQLGHCGVRVVQLVLLLLRFLILGRELLDEDTDEVGVDDGVDDIDAKHEYELILGARIHLHQGKADRRVVPRCAPLVRQ